MKKNKVLHIMIMLSICISGLLLTTPNFYYKLWRKIS